MEQGAPDPFFPDQRRMTEADIVDEAAKNGDYDLPSSPHRLGVPHCTCGRPISDPCRECE
jgi:hypothetical protein